MASAALFSLSIRSANPFWVSWNGSKPEYFNKGHAKEENPNKGQFLIMPESKDPCFCLMFIDTYLDKETLKKLNILFGT